MVAERPDWCISRQRFWGVPITVFYCEDCRALLDDAKMLRHVLPFFEKEGADAWYTHSAEELLPPGTRCAKCGQSRWRKETDILDVWFDSGSTHLAVLDPPGTPTPNFPGPPTCTSKVPTSIAAGSRARCSSVSACTAARPTSTC